MSLTFLNSRREGRNTILDTPLICDNKEQKVSTINVDKMLEVDHTLQTTDPINLSLTMITGVKITMQR